MELANLHRLWNLTKEFIAQLDLILARGVKH